MPPKTIKGDGFKGTTELSLTQWRSLEVVSSASAPELLLRNWSGNVTGFLTCQLANDHKSIRQMSFHLGGLLFEGDGLRCSADAFFDESPPPGVKFSFSIPPIQTSLFSFPNGSLTSALVDSSALKVSWYKDDAFLTPEQREEEGVPGFSVRCHVIPKQVLGSGTWGAIHLTLLPLPKSTLLELHPLAAKPNYPCLKIYSGNSFPIGFKTSAVFPDTDCGTPLVPALLTGGDWENLPHTPSTQALRAAIAATLRNVCLPDVRKEVKTVKKAWEDLASAGEAGLKNTNHALKTIWPLPPAPPSRQPQGSSLV